MRMGVMLLGIGSVQAALFLVALQIAPAVLTHLHRESTDPRAERADFILVLVLSGIVIQFFLFCGVFLLTARESSVAGVGRGFSRPVSRWGLILGGVLLNGGVLTSLVASEMTELLMTAGGLGLLVGSIAMLVYLCGLAQRARWSVIEWQIVIFFLACVALGVRGCAVPYPADAHAALEYEHTERIYTSPQPPSGPTLADLLPLARPLLGLWWLVLLLQFYLMLSDAIYASERPYRTPAHKPPGG